MTNSAKTITDLELTRLCAEAMGIPVRLWKGAMDDQPEHYVAHSPHRDTTWTPLYVYDPLHDDAQAMQLVKRFELLIDPPLGETDWTVEWFGGEYVEAVGRNADLNRAIVECVSKMQASK